ncbi:MAG: PilC/PilY family type IV pilus protein [Pseudomonadota bacterium]
MNHFHSKPQYPHRAVLLALLLSTTVTQPASAAPITLATVPLATSTTSTVQPNLLFVLDDSGSMSWTFMPDTANDFHGKVGYQSNQCNGVYYNPGTTYNPPVDASGTEYTDASFTAARDDGFDSSSTARNLSSAFIANRFSPDSANSTYDNWKSYLNNSGADSLGPYAAQYFNYSGSQTTKSYLNSSSTFYQECDAGFGEIPGNGSNKFTRIVLSSSAAATSATIAIGGTSSTSVSGIKVNGTQEIMSGTASASTSSSTVASNIAAQINLCTNAKVGNCTTVGGHGYTAATSGSSTVTITGLTATATTLIITKGNTGTMTLFPTIFPVADSNKLTNFANWYSFYRTRMLMMKSASGRAFSSLTNQYRVGLSRINSSSAPALTIGTFENTQRTNWYNALYNSDPSGSTPLRTALANAGRYYAGKLASDPVQYSCQQNFTILSTDGYWNDSNNPNRIDGSTDIGNQDGTADKPMWDGGVATGSNTVTITYTRNDYSCGGCNSSTNKLRTRPQIGSCNVTVSGTPTGTESCNPASWSDNGSSTYGACVSNSACNNSIPSPDPSTKVETSRITTTTVSGGGSNTLADVAMYYYQTDLRTTDLDNCTGALGAGEDVCENNVFQSSTDSNLQQHMTTFTLGLGASGKMTYSSSYLTDTSGDFFSVKLGSTAKLGNSKITVSGSGSTSVSSITVNGVQLMSGTSTADTEASVVAANIAAKITQNSFSATSSGNTVMITGPASAAGYTPVITQSGTMLIDAVVAPICSWQTHGTVCTWPVPSSGAVANIDDLWHAAVNGRGAYFSASDPDSLSSGLSNALAGINARRGAAAAAATSTLNPVAGNNYAFVASYTTVAWKGNLEARGINTETGAVSENASWCLENVVAGNCPSPGSVVPEDAGDTTTYYCITPNSVICNDGILDGTDCKVPVATSCTGTMSNKVGDVNDTRTIKTANSSGTALIDFTYANLTASQQAYFAAANIDTLNQWSTLTATQQTAAEGTNLVNYLRGQHGYENRSANAVDNRLYRYREAVLGDALESEPAFMGPPVFNYPYPGYTSFKSAQSARDGVVYMGSNDGMMHAFYAQDSAGAGTPCVIGAIAGEHCGGEEAWAYVPSMVIENMWKLADINYSTLHTNYVNGSPITSDVCVANCTDAATAVWKTILVAGLSGGGRGYFALDITDPAAPSLLWEITTSAGIGSVQDDDMGYSFGHPIITRKQDGTWVVLVTSGYNNISPGTGKGFLYVLNASTGAIISKIGTGIGSTTTPSGFSHIVGWNDEPAGNQAGYVYGGDLQGNLWRFDINSTVVGSVAAGEIGNGDVMLFATLKDPSGVVQPITTTPVLGKINEKRVVFVGTGKYLETSDLTTTQVQSIYAIKDDNATSTLVNARNSLIHQTLANNIDGSASRTSGNVNVDFYTDRGWYIDLPDAGERVNIDSTLVQGTLIVPTIVPSNTVCSPGGYGWLNYLDYRTGGAVDVSTSLVSKKLDSTIVGVNVLYIDGTPKVGVVTSTNPTPTLIDAVSFAANAPVFSGKRVIWRELIP